MDTNDSTQKTLPWYRYGIVWLVIILPAIAVTASITTVIIAHQNAPEINKPVADK